ncbi:transposase [Chitinispirillales bacterium ANBcel5]|uniref:transposase n=1 Tax=Cellulosispirillum alkaliphilum TaxID=3039283 RepID=UPI002A537E5F|nr:transposase [Chitinispirillales bacterium ANBcel5]
MPRTRRIEEAGSFYHIMAHSIEGKDMFLDDDDRYEFLSRLEKGLNKTGFECYTWTLMDNHYHMLIRTNHLRLEKLMRGLNGGYAQYYNHKYNRTGYLFQNRFKSALCQDQDYTAQLVKYINLNPLRAGKVKSLEQLKAYTWCGHGYLLGKNCALGKNFQSRKDCLRRFGKEEIEAVENYLKFLEENYVEESPQEAGSLSETEKKEIVKSCKGWPAVIGKTEFVSKTMEKYWSNMNGKYRRGDYLFILEKTAQWVCRKHNIELHELFKRGWKNNRSEARILFCNHLYKKELIPISVIAQYLKITISPVVKMINAGETYYKTGNQLNKDDPLH